MATAEFTPQIAAIKRETRERIEALFGTQAACARAYGIADRRIRLYLASPPATWEPVPAWLLAALRDGVMAKREISIIGPEPGSTADEDRDEAAYRAVEPALTALMQAGINAGWHPAEITTAALSFITEVMIDGAGPAAAQDALSQAMEIAKTA